MEGEIIGQLFLATLLGALIGLEREIKKREAGLQTYSLVTLAACLFVIVAIFLSKLIKFDLGPVFIAIGAGMGFIGAGTIFKVENKIEGLTTAAGLWTVAAIGMAVGARFYLLAVCATFLVLFILTVFGKIEKNFLSRLK